MSLNKYFFRGLLFFTAVLVIFTVTLTSCGKKNESQSETGIPSRIISLAPSITETLCALGLGNRVVGVTEFCNYPPAVKNIDKIGGYVDPNYEAILRLKPDLVILIKEYANTSEFLKKNDIPYLVVDNRSIKSILESIILIGKRCGKYKTAQKLHDSISTELNLGTKPACTEKYEKPKVLLCVGRVGIGSGKVSKVWAAGVSKYYSLFYNELINAAGGRNVIVDSLLDSPVLSAEGIIRLKPDIIIDVIASMAEISEQELARDWEKLDKVPAVKNKMVFCLSGDYTTIPGPRIVLLYKDIKRIIGEYIKKHKAED